MVRDFSGYSIAELNEGLAIVDGRKNPENKAAIEAELQARKDSGAYESEQAAAILSEKERTAAKVSSAKRATKFVAWFLILSPMLAFSGCTTTAGEQSFLALGIVVGLLFSIISICAGIGLLKERDWGHWAAVAVLGIQVLRVESEVFIFNFLSSVGLFTFYAEGGDIGFSVEFDPGFLLAIDPGANLLVGVNLFVVGLLVILATARQKVE